MNRTSKKPTVHVSAFDAEQFWRNPSVARLPYLPDPSARRIVHAMEELPFLFCREGDVLLTRYPLIPEHLDYLHSLGFYFRNNRTPIAAEGENTSISSIELLSRERAPLDLVREGMELAPYAVIPETDALCHAWKLSSTFPPMDVVRSVNSKFYSCKMRERIGIRNIAVTLNSTEELAAFLAKLPADGDYLLKEEFGVSGQGNLRIQSPAVGERILKHCRAQEKKGLSVQLIAEPFLDKEADLSCQFFISPQGDYTLISVQQIWNTGLAYQGSVTPSAPFMEALQKQGYFRQMEQVAMELYHDGYYGHVCVDSMVLRDGSLEPIVEINARKSMSLMKHAADQYLQFYGMVGVMTYLPIQGVRITSFSEVLELLRSNGLLFQREQPRGILPLSGNMLLINQPPEPGQSPFKGKFYLCAVGENAEEAFRWIEKWKRLMPDCGIRTV